MPKFIDLSGQRFGCLKVIERTKDRISPSGAPSTMWLCQCDCGNTAAVSASALRRGQTVSCGCQRSRLISSSKLNDLTGKRFGKLVVIGLSDKHAPTSHRRTYYDCQCDCGKTSIVCAESLRAGITRSCGCLMGRCSGRRTKRPWNSAHKKHGLSNTRVYKIYQGMIKRCYTKGSVEYKSYGGRGISVCKEWRDDFVTFYNWAINNGYDDSLSIDRIDVNEGYSPQNCRWATPLEQANNMTTNVLVEYNSKTQSIAQWARELGVKYEPLRRAIKSGKSIEEYLSVSNS